MGNPINPFINILALSVSITILFQSYLFLNSITNYCKQRNKHLIIAYLTEVTLLLLYPIILILPIFFSSSIDLRNYNSNKLYKSPIYTFLVENFNFVAQILFKNITIYLLLNNTHSFIFMACSTCLSLICLYIPYKELSRLLFICVSTSEYLLLLVVAYNLTVVREFIILLVLKVLEIINIFDLSRSNQSIIEILSYLIQFEVVKKKILNRTLKDYNNKGNNLEYDEEGLSVLDELYQ